MADLPTLNNLTPEEETNPIRCWAVALWATAIALLAMLPTIVQYKGLYIIRGDFSDLYLPNMIEAKRLLLTGSPWWSHNVGFGAGAGVMLSGSPFFWLSMLFPEKWMPWVIGYITILKLAVAACFAFIALKMFVSNRSAAIGALLYTFSGYTIVNTEFHPMFADVIALFPLLIVGVERVIRKQSHSFVILVTSIVLNILANYYLFVASSMFCLLYVIFRIFSDEVPPKTRMRLIATITFAYLLGLGLASVVVFQKLYVSVLECARATSRPAGPWWQWLFFEPLYYLELLRVFLMPSEGLAQHAFYPETVSWASIGIYLPVFGFTFALIHLVKYKNWLSRLVIAYLIISFVPLFNYTFSGFSQLAYTRWWHGLAFILSVSTMRVLDDRDTIPASSFRGYYWIPVALCLALSVSFGIIGLFPKIFATAHSILHSEIFIWWFDIIKNSPFTGGCSYILTVWLICLLNYLLLWLIIYHKPSYRAIIICVAIAAVANYGAFVQLNNQCRPSKSTVPYLEHLISRAVLQGHIIDSSKHDYWRIDHPHQIRNYGRFVNASSPNIFTSIRNRNSSLFEKMTDFGLYDSVDSLMPFDRPALRSLLSVKYFVNYDPKDFELTMPGYKLVQKTANTDIYENQYYVPMGFSYDTYISESQLSKYSDCIEKVMLKAVVLSDEQIAKYGSYMEQYAADVKKCADFDWMSDALEMKKHTCTNYTADSKGFAARIELDAPRMVFFSVPYGTGWSAFIDGKPAQIEKVNIGFLGLMLPSGQHEIEFRYFPPGLNLGAIVSGVSVIILLGYFICAAIVTKRSSNRAYEGFSV